MAGKYLYDPTVQNKTDLALTDRIPVSDPASGPLMYVTVQQLADLIAPVADTTAPTVTSATVINATTIRVVFSEVVTATNIGWSFKKNGSAHNPTGISGSGTNTLDFTVGTILDTDTILRSYNSGTGDTADAASNGLVSFTDSAVTNSLSTAPTVVSATAINANTIRIVFSETVVPTTAGWSFNNGSALTITGVTGSGTTWDFAITETMTDTDALKRAYNSTTGNTVDTATIPNELVTFGDTAVTNSIPPAAVLITANRLFDFDFDEGTGQRVFNKVGPNTSNDNLLSMSEQYLQSESSFWTTSFLKTPLDTLTPNYAANKDGISQAYRLQTGAGAGVNGTYGTPLGLRLQGIAMPAGSTKMLAYVKSNTGSAQTMRMAYDNGDTFSSDLNVTTAWTQVEFTFTHAGGAKHLHFGANGSGGAALDILIDQLMIIPAAGSTVYVTPKLDICFGKYGTTESIDPTWEAARGINLDGTQFGYAITDVAASPTSFSLYVVGMARSAGTTQNYPIATAFNDNGFQMRWGVGGTADSGILPSFKFSNSAVVPLQTLKLADDAIHIVAAVYDEVAEMLYYYVDGILFGTLAATGLSATSIKRMLLSDTDDVGGRYFNGKLYKIVGFTDGHDATEVAQETAALRALMISEGFTMAANDVLILTCGDSLSDVDQGGTWPRKATRRFTTNILSDNVAVVGRTMTAGINSIQNDAALIDSYYDASRTHNILNVFIGANDVATPGAFVAADFVATLKAFCLARIAVGWKINLCDLLANTTNNAVANRNAVNALLPTDTSYYHNLTRLSLNASIGTDAACLDIAKFPDGVHGSDSTYETIADEVFPDWQALIA